MSAELNIEECLQSFQTVNLADLEKVKLQDRNDYKFLFHQSKLETLLEEMQQSYSVLEIDRVKSMRYETLYFDTSDFTLYHEHHNGKLNRYKVRSRTYIDTDTSFLEIKFKDNKSRTIKKRKSLNSISVSHDSDDQEYIQENIEKELGKLDHKLWVYYNRVTFTDKNFSERITLDSNLNFKTPNGDREDLKDIVIVEVKRDKLSKDSRVLQKLRRMKILPTGMSKYCMGISALYPNVKQNNLKATWRKIEKLKLSL